MLQTALISCLLFILGVDAVPLADPSFDSALTTWAPEGSLALVKCQVETRGGTVDTTTGQCLSLAPGAAVRSASPVIKGLSDSTVLDLNLSLVQFDAPGARLKVDLIDEEGTLLASQSLVADQNWTRRRVSLPAKATTSGVLWLRLERLGGDTGKILVDNMALERVDGVEPGFTPLFDGRTLNGWVGDTEGYEVVDHAIRCKPDGGGDLRSAAEYDDFILRFDFKLTSGGNNGIAVRAPIEGNAAYEGMEIQVIDNTAEQYADLKPWQFHGSAYGLSPAERGWMLPPGTWNREEIRLDGDHVTVTLNGHVILDTHLDAILEAGPPSGASHPGARRTSGHIGFCGHGSDVAFRNIRIHPLKKPGNDS